MTRHAGTIGEPARGISSRTLYTPVLAKWRTSTPRWKHRQASGALAAEHGEAMELGLAGRTAVVTGASKGIGLAVARGLAAEGCAVHLVARSQAALEEAASRIRTEYKVSATAHALDLSRSESIAALLAATGTPDILVNNAGAIPGGDLQAVDEARWRTAWDLKVFGYINMSRAYYAAMKPRGTGVVINVTGLAADRLDSGYIAGSTGNAGLNAFTRTLGSYSLEDGIRVLAVSPGAVETERLVTLMRTRAARPARRRRALARIRGGPAARTAGHRRGSRQRRRLRRFRSRVLPERHRHYRGRRAQRERRRVHALSALLVVTNLLLETDRARTRIIGSGTGCGCIEIPIGRASHGNPTTAEHKARDVQTFSNDGVVCG